MPCRRIRPFFANYLLLRRCLVLRIVLIAYPFGLTVIKMRLCHHWVEIASSSFAIFANLHTYHLLLNLV